MQTKHPFVLIHMWNKGEVGTIKTCLSPPVKIFLPTFPRPCFFWGSFLLFMFRACHAFLSVYCSLVVTCWEKAGLLALLYVMLSCVLSLSHVVSWDRCGTWLYWFLIFAFLLTILGNTHHVIISSCKAIRTVSANFFKNTWNQTTIEQRGSTLIMRVITGLTLYNVTLTSQKSC